MYECLCVCMCVCGLRESESDLSFLQGLLWGQASQQVKAVIFQLHLSHQYLCIRQSSRSTCPHIQKDSRHTLLPLSSSHHPLYLSHTHTHTRCGCLHRGAPGICCRVIAGGSWHWQGFRGVQLRGSRSVGLIRCCQASPLTLRDLRGADLGD